MKKFKIPSTPSTTNKCIRFPNDVIEQVEESITGKECTFIRKFTRWPKCLNHFHNFCIKIKKDESKFIFLYFYLKIFLILLANVSFLSTLLDKFSESVFSLSLFSELLNILFGL